jgi:hypothetical protein
MAMSKQNAFLRLLAWLSRHKADVIVMLVLLVIGGTVSAVNMTGYPQRFEDEGTYVSQAWAVKEQGALAHYTYWYDHPPVGWIQIAAYLAVSNGLERYGSAITAGREFMLVLHLATIGLLYALTRRLGINRVAGAAGVLLYALSPLSVEFSRYVLLDNVALPWLLGAFLLALSPRRSLGAAIGAAVCLAIAVLSKETLLVLLPVVLYALWRNGDMRNRRYTLVVFGVVFGMICAAYILYAALKNELFPGDGHVSLFGTVFWQLFGREGSGSILDESSATYGLVQYWLGIDYLLIAAGVAAMIPALIMRNLRPIGLSLLISLAMLLRSGYLPYPYVVVILPFAALCVAGVLDWLIKVVSQKRIWLPLRACAGLALVELVIATAIVAVPAWQPKLSAAMSRGHDTPSQQAVEWVANNVPRSDRLVVESALWTDLKGEGFPQHSLVWLYKTETDPAVKKDIGGWKGIDYVVLNGPTVGSDSFEHAFPTTAEAIEHGKLVAEFGQDNQKVLVYKVAKK